MVRKSYLIIFPFFFSNHDYASCQITKTKKIMTHDLALYIQEYYPQHVTSFTVGWLSEIILSSYKFDLKAD